MMDFKTGDTVKVTTDIYNRREGDEAFEDYTFVPEGSVGTVISDYIDNEDIYIDVSFPHSHLEWPFEEDELELVSRV